MTYSATILHSEIKTKTSLWQLVDHDLAVHYGEHIYKNWFSKIEFIEIQNSNSVLLGVPSNFIRDWIKSNYQDMIRRICTHYDHNLKYVEIITREQTLQTEEDTQKNIKENQISPQSKTKKTNLSFDSRFTFENFVVGKSNELAYNIALSIAESDIAIAKSNPLFLYGGVGLGKTHLMHAIAWKCKERNPERKILYISAEKFMYNFIKALREKNVISFKDEFRSVDILMIDDIQFLCGKNSTQEEFFHTFNAIIDNNKQIIISCDRSPNDLDNIDDRMRSRLGWGLVADVHSTTYELRIAILESKLRKLDIKVPQNVINLIASRVISNVRELEGALNKVIAHSSIMGCDIDLKNAQNILRGLLRYNEKTIDISDIKAVIANKYNIKIDDLSSYSRSKIISKPRQIAMYLSKILTSKSLVDIANSFERKNHTTIIHAVKSIEELIVSDNKISNEIDSIKDALIGKKLG